MRDLVLGIDVGSTTSKAALIDLEGHVVALEATTHQVLRPRPGWAEQDPETVWWADVVTLCRRLLEPSESVRGNSRVVAVAAAALGPCLVLADEAGRPLRPAILYGIDTRATAEIDDLNERLGTAAILARCGSPLSSQAVGPKLGWVARHEPDVLLATQRLFSASSYLVHRLTGEYVLDHHTASQWVPLYDVNTNRWIDEWAAVAACGRQLPALPPLRWPQELAGVVSTEAESATGLPAGIPVAAGTVDSFAELVGAGVRSPGELLLVYGTTMFLAEAMTAARPDSRLWSPTSFAPGSRNLTAGTAAGGALAGWVRDLTGEQDFALLTAEANSIPPGADGLVVLPHFAGERTPLFDPRARGVVAGLSLSHTRAHVFRAALEGIAFSVRHILDVMRSVGCTPARLVASDAELKGMLWPQIMSDVTGLEQSVLTSTAVATIGSALLAAVAAGRADLKADWSGQRRVVRPNPATATAYDYVYHVYRDLYPATRKQQHALADFAEDRETRSTAHTSLWPLC